MVKCPFCQFDNEDGAIFCEQCKSDLGSEAVAMRGSSAPAPLAPEVPFAAVLEEPSSTASLGDAASVEDSPFDFLGQATPIAPLAALSPAAAPAPEPPPVAEVLSSPPAPLPRGEVLASAPPAKPAADADRLPADAQPRLLVLRGQKMNVEYPLYEGHNFIGRTDERPVDIDLEDQEPPDRVWSSRQHAVITYEDGKLSIEDLNSSNGTFVNRARIYPGQKRPLKANDIIQIGTVQMKVRV